MSEYSIYPKAIDGYAQIPLAVDKKSPINAESVNRLRSGVINIEKAIGIAPGFSGKLGDFPDLSGRIDHLEGLCLNLSEEMQFEVESQVSALDVEDFLEDLTLTDLYDREQVIYLDSGPLQLNGSEFLTLHGPEADDSLDLAFGSDSKNFELTSSAGVSLKAGGLIPVSSPGALSIGFDNFPRSVSIKTSDSIPFYDDGSPAFISAYLCFGGEMEESELAVLKMKREDRVVISMMAGLAQGFDDEASPVDLEMQCFPSARPGVDGGNLYLKAASTMHEEDTAGSIQVVGGDTGGSDMGAGISIGGGSHQKGGPLSLSSGDGQTGGDVVIASGQSGSGDPSRIILNANGESGSIEIKANGTEIDGSLSLTGSVSMSIRRFVASGGGASICMALDDDYTILVDAGDGTTTVTLPSPGGVSGRIYVIKKIDNVNPVIIAIMGGSWSGWGIEGSATLTLPNQGDFVKLQSDGSGWYQIG